MIGLTMVFFFFEGICILVHWVTKRVKCFKRCLLNHTIRSVEDSVVKSYLNCGELDQVISQENFNLLSKESFMILW